MIRVLKTIRIALRGIEVVDLVDGDKMELRSVDEASLISMGFAKEWNDEETSADKVLTDVEFSYDFATTIKDKKELDEYAATHGYKLDRRSKRSTMLESLEDQFTS
jgi:hypothetical protein